MNNGHKKSVSRKGKKGGGNRRAGQKSETTDVTNPNQPYRLAMAVSPIKLTYMNPRRQMPFPTRFRTIMTSGFRGIIPAGSTTVQYFCKLTSVNLPFAGGGWPNSSPAVATLYPAGCRVIWNTNLYNRFRVESSRIKVILSPVTSLDTMLVSITPGVFANVPASAQIAISQPNAVWKTISYSTPESARTLTNRIAVHQLVGVRKQAIEDDLSGQFYGNIVSGTPVEPVAQHYWVLNAERNDSGSVNSNFGFEVELQHEVEFFSDDDGQNVIVLETPARKY